MPRQAGTLVGFGRPGGAEAAALPRWRGKGCLRTAAAGLALALAFGASAPLGRAQEVTIGYQAVVNPYKVAIADGAIEESTGYTVTWKRFDSGREILEALAQGHVDIVTAGSGLVATALSYQLPAKLFWVAESIESAEALVVRRGSGIVAPQDLRGKRIAVPTGSTTHYHLLFALEQFGIGRDEVLLDYLSPDSIVGAWEKGAVDAAFVWHPALGRLLESGKVLLTSGLLSSWGRPTFDGLVARDGFANANKGFMCEFVRTVAAADEAYRNDPQAFAPGTANAAKIARLAGGDEADVAEVLAQYTFPTLDEQAGPNWLRGGAAAALESTALFLRDEGLIRSADADYGAGVTPEFANAAASGCPVWPGPATSADQLLDPTWMRYASRSQIEALLNQGADVNAMDGGFGRTPLHVAAGWNADVSVVELLLNRGADLDAMEIYGRTALHVAAGRNRNPAVAELLLERGADPEDPDVRGWTALAEAVAGGNAGIAEILRRRGQPPADAPAWRLIYSDWVATATVEALAALLDFDRAAISRSGPYGGFLHRVAWLNPDPAAAELLLERGADLRTTSGDGQTVLHRAAANANPAVAALLLDRGADIAAKNLYGQSALHTAALWNENPAVVELLLDRGADPNALENGGQTALHLTAGNGNPAVAQLLLDRGADPSVRGFTDRTPLDTAAQHGALALATLLLDRGADPNAKGYSGWTALHHATGRPAPAVAELLLDRGAEIDARDGSGRTPLDLAARSPARPGAAALVELLLARGASREGFDERFWEHSAPAWIASESLARVREWLGRVLSTDESPPDTFLIAAARNPDPAVAELLLARGADASATDRGGRPALHQAAANRNPAVAELLLDRGADPTAVDRSGRTALHWAVASESSEAMAALLLDRGAAVNALDSQDQTALHLAARWDLPRSAALATTLLERGADPDAVDRLGRTALHWAARRNPDPALAELLLDHSSNPDAADAGGATALTLAALNPRWAVTEALLGRGLAESDLEERLLDPAWLRAASPVELDAQVANASHGHLLERDECGRTALHLVSHYAARNLSNSTTVENSHQGHGYGGLLRRADFMDIDLPDRNGNTVLHYAVAGAAKAPPENARQGPAPGWQVLNQLWTNLRADPKAEGGGGLWPVHYAVPSGNFADGGGRLAQFLATDTDPLIDPLTYEPFPNGQVPADRYDACIVSLP